MSLIDDLKNKQHNTPNHQHHEEANTTNTNAVNEPKTLPLGPNDGKEPINLNTADLTPPIIKSDGANITEAVRETAPVPDVKLGPNDIVIERREVEENPDQIYSTPLSEQFSLQLSDGIVTAKDGVLKVSQHQHEEIQKLIKSGRPDIAQNVVLLNPKAAEQIARDYMERHKRPDAVKGIFDSQAAGFREIKPNEDGRVENDLNRQAAVAENLRRLGVQEEGVIHAEDQAIKDGDPNNNVIGGDQPRVAPPR